MVDFKVKHKNHYTIANKIEYHKGSNITDVIDSIILNYKDICDIHCTYIEGQIYLYIFNDKFIITVLAITSSNELTYAAITSDLLEVKKLSNDLNRYFDEIKIIVERESLIDWAYSTANGYETKTIPFNDNLVYKDCLYPWIKEGIKSYIEKFNKSDSNILILLSEPGTGKSSFIRQILNLNKPCKALMTFDNNVFMSEKFYISYISNTNYNFLILEDADILLEKRENGTNTIMNRLLNISDGILKDSKKKIIFSTNLKDLNYVDPAIIRPGRCFDVLKFEHLTLKEANVISKEYNLPLLEQNKEYTLAEVFNRNPRSYVQQKTGFI